MYTCTTVIPKRLKRSTNVNIGESTSQEGKHWKTTYMDAATAPSRAAPIVLPRVFFMLRIHVVRIAVIPVKGSGVG